MNKMLSGLITNFYFGLTACLFFVHQIIQHVHAIYFIDSYLDPFLCAILLISLHRIERYYLFSVSKPMQLWEVFLISLWLGVVSEEIFPRYSDAFTRDPWDYVAFILGGIYFWFLINKKMSL